MARGTLYLLDTNILLALVRGKDLANYITQTYGLAEILKRPLISVVSHGELLAMAARQSWIEKKRESLNAVLASMITMDLNDPEILAGYVAVDQANLKVKGGSRALSNNDMWIAATTRAANAVLLTSDKDFLHLHPNVCAVEYVNPQSKLPETISGSQQTIQ
ncbi:type II toxin-antitoxin system VapC family toxin [Alloacidobacterium dinghuense]|uniref:Type II toxin-antitoxin system VapC family toxin n=1 Tax=Alloacidobacterium dinghuense TaxID=2763107 RepID=A0A7G8BGB7_9BACT|nr:type II toxin-antitoxin system VapC family toxin [Alloacidobacterium dinghuense]QNI31587.1 type II toxin-antitoxin system VapC family toxin [Alloacidobacterium dinghuense]